MAGPQRQRDVWLAGVPVNRDLLARVAVHAHEPTRRRLAKALQADAVMPRLDHADEERLLRALMTECPRELDELYHELLRRCQRSRGGGANVVAGDRGFI